MALLPKVRQLRRLYPELEISWDGGVNDQSAPLLLDAGVNVLCVGSFISDAPDPASAYATLKTLI
jgi:ribulose-phosphate 3-epimerase